MGGLTLKRSFSPIPILLAFFVFLAGMFRSRAALQIEILALRHQLNVLQRSVKRPRLNATDRWLWAWLSRRWPEWRRALVIVKADTVIRWQRKGFRLFWTWKSRQGQRGRPAVAKDIRLLIRRMNRDNLSVVKTLSRFLSAFCESVLTVRRSSCSVVDVPCVPSTVRRCRRLKSVLPKSPRYIFGNPGPASSSGRLETETQASSADPDRPALLDHIAERLVAMVRCLSDR